MKVNGNLIREARVKKGYKQDVLADILGISQSQYSKLENGETAFDIRTLSTLIDELDLNPRISTCLLVALPPRYISSVVLWGWG